MGAPNLGLDALARLSLTAIMDNLDTINNEAIIKKMSFTMLFYQPEPTRFQIVKRLGDKYLLTDTENRTSYDSVITPEITTIKSWADTNGIVFMHSMYVLESDDSWTLEYGSNIGDVDNPSALLTAMDYMTRLQADLPLL